MTIKRDIIYLGCSAGRHNWQLIGGRNAACARGIDDCHCSVPVHQCADCRDCDYGDNAEATEIIEQCAKLS